MCIRDRLIVYPPKDVTYDRSENIVIGNVALYGATAGKAFINGVAGERFCAVSYTHLMRVCNLDTCPMGICTQNPELRKRLKGKPEYIINFMRFMAEELREYMARLGVHTVDELGLTAVTSCVVPSPQSIVQFTVP